MQADGVKWWYCAMGDVWEKVGPSPDERASVGVEATNTAQAKEWENFGHGVWVAGRTRDHVIALLFRHQWNEASL